MFADPDGHVDVTAAKLLGEVLGRARETVGVSPERVGEQTGVNGRTIRRLEDGESRRPRRTTLQVLASFYGVDGEFLGQLAEWSASGAAGDSLEQLVFARARKYLGEAVIADLDEQEEGDLLITVALRLARHHLRGPTPSARSLRAGVAGSDYEEIADLVDTLGGLSKRRRRIAGELIAELHRAQTAEQALRRRDRLGVAAEAGREVAEREPSE